jgi:hypothetical protein
LLIEQTGDGGPETGRRTVDDGQRDRTGDDSNNRLARLDRTTDDRRQTIDDRRRETAPEGKLGRSWFLKGIVLGESL